MGSPFKKNLTRKLPNTALAAVAYQDHLLQDLSIGNLSLIDPFKNKPSLSRSLKNQEKRRKNLIKNAKPTVDTGLKKKETSQTKKFDENAEFVLDAKPRPLSLAQKFGLIPYTKDQEKLLSENEWKELKQTSMEREDFRNPCVICKDSFRLEDQVLLSCSHVFHKACLQAFERFSGKKTCPMCRHSFYQTRVVHEGSVVYKHKCAARIQSHWRGYVVRKWYLQLRRTHPPVNPQLRKKFYEEKLSEITDRLVAMTSSDRVDRFLSDIDDSIAQSRDILQHFENVRLSKLSDENWLEISVKAADRGATECPICLRAFSADKREDGDKHVTSFEPITLLSCSHVFHCACLNALELFSLDSIESNITSLASSSAGIESPLQFKCPVCRSHYTKREYYGDSKSA